MWVEITESDEIVQHLECGERLQDSTLLDKVVVHGSDYNKILTTLVSCDNPRIKIKICTTLPFNDLNRVTHMFDEYENVDTGLTCVKFESWRNV